MLDIRHRSMRLRRGRKLGSPWGTLITRQGLDCWAGRELHRRGTSHKLGRQAGRGSKHLPKPTVRSPNFSLKFLPGRNRGFREGDSDGRPLLSPLCIDGESIFFAKQWPFRIIPVWQKLLERCTSPQVIMLCAMVTGVWYVFGWSTSLRLSFSGRLP